MDVLEIIHRNGVCCITGKPLKDCRQLNWVQVNMIATWPYPVWGNILSGVQCKMAVAFVHDDCLDARGTIVGDLVHAIQVNNGEIIYHPVKLVWDPKKQGIDTSDFTEKSIERLRQIRLHHLQLFQFSTGRNFHLKGSPLVDEIIGVDHEMQLVKGKQYGDFHIDLCELVPTSVNKVLSSVKES
jgi:hypothetical protein